MQHAGHVLWGLSSMQQLQQGPPPRPEAPASALRPLHVPFLPSRQHPKHRATHSLPLAATLTDASKKALENMSKLPATITRALLRACTDI